MLKPLAVSLFALLAFGCSTTQKDVAYVENANASRVATETLGPPEELQLFANTEPNDRGVLNIAVENWGQPAYPDEAKKKGVGGVVLVRVTVDKNGSVAKAKAEDGHPLLSKAAEEWAMARRIQPYRVGGATVDSKGVLAVRFGK